MAAAIANVRAAFREREDPAAARRRAACSRPTCSTRRSRTPAFSDYSAFQPLVQALADESRRFDGPVYLFNGDSHRFNQDRPLASGSSWLDFYGVKHSADNLRRVTVDGSDLGEADWLKVTVQPRGEELLAFEKVPGA